MPKKESPLDRKQRLEEQAHRRDAAILAQVRRLAETFESYTESRWFEMMLVCQAKGFDFAARVQALEDFNAERNAEQQKKQRAQAIEQLEKQLAAAEDPDVKAQIAKHLETLRGA